VGPDGHRDGPQRARPPHPERGAAGGHPRPGRPHDQPVAGSPRRANQRSMPTRPSGTNGQRSGSSRRARRSARVTHSPHTISSGWWRTGPSQRAS
jgi:hypothetical protein